MRIATVADQSGGFRQPCRKDTEDLGEFPQAVFEPLFAIERPLGEEERASDTAGGLGIDQLGACHRHRGLPRPTFGQTVVALGAHVRMQCLSSSFWFLS
jgi:hypothetical protein